MPLKPTRDAMDYSQSAIAEASAASPHLQQGTSHKKLRRLPHIFSKVLELPFSSDIDVAVEENPHGIRFVAETGRAIGDCVRAHAVEIHPGVTKVVVREGGGREGSGEGVELLLRELEVDAWRFRLPAASQPELASAAFSDGVLVVTVPKSGRRAGGEACGGVGRLIPVQ